MKLSSEASYLISECYDKKNEPQAFIIEIGEKFIIGKDESEKYKITNELIEELTATGRLRVVLNGKDKYMITGLRGRHKE